MDLGREIERLGVRRLMVLVRNLPPDSAIGRGANEWTVRDEMAAMAVEVEDAWGRMIYDLLHRVHAKPPHDLPNPIVIRHPAREKLRGAVREQGAVQPIEQPVQRKVSLREAIEAVSRS